MTMTMVLMMVMMEKEEEEGGRERKEDENGDAGDSAGGRVTVMVVTSPFTSAKILGYAGKRGDQKFHEEFCKNAVF